jgi:integrase
MGNLLKRGNTWYARLTVPEARWADVGVALKAKSGICREKVRTLETTDHRQATQRRDHALAEIQAEIDRALRLAKLPPLTDWTADWMGRATLHRSEMEAGKSRTAFYEAGPDGSTARWTEADLTREGIESNARDVEARQGPEAAARFIEIALGDGLSIAEAGRRWLEELDGKRRNQSLKGHATALALLGSYLERVAGLGPLEGVSLLAVTRQIAGEFLAHRQRQASTTTGRVISASTVKREFSAYSGLWRWAMRRGYTETTPWADQLAGIEEPRQHDAAHQGRPTKRAFTTGEIVTLLNATATDLAPNGGGYAATFYDLIRLFILTGARPKSLLSMTCGDIWGRDGTPEALVIREDKTPAGRRVLPLHSAAAHVITARLASLPDTTSSASLWPEVPPQGRDQNRAKPISTRFVAVRRRLLGDTAGLELYSFRRTFITAAETAMHSDRPITGQMLALLVGHTRGALAFDVYSEWSRLSKPALRSTLADRMETLRRAVDDIVTFGLGPAVVEALEATTANRPAVTRTAPAFLRKNSPIG